MLAPSDDLKCILALRDSLNASIDAYVSLKPEEKLQKPKVDQARQQILSTATKLAAETLNPMQEATLLSFMVDTEDNSSRIYSLTLLLAMAKCSRANRIRIGPFQPPGRIYHGLRDRKENRSQRDTDRCASIELKGLPSDLPTDQHRSSHLANLDWFSHRL
jgi:regulator of sirC expression with transglutaminase-like and TPR domain